MLTVWILMGIAGLTVWIWRLWSRHSGDGRATDAMLESFALQMEEENDRLIEMMASLRRHVDDRLASVSPPFPGAGADLSPEPILLTTGRLASIEHELLRLRLRIERLEQPATTRRSRRPGTSEAKLTGAKPSKPDIMPYDASAVSIPEAWQAYSRAPFREATRRIAAGEEARAVGRELGLVRGEVEILERLVRAEAREGKND